MRAFRSTSSIGSCAITIRSRTGAGRDRHREVTSSITFGSSGSSSTDVTAGPARTRRASTRPAMWSAKPRSTPAGSFSRSQRETWSTIRVAFGSAACSRIESTSSSSMSRFFGANGSMQGGMIATRARSRPSHTCACREKMRASAPAT